MAEKIHYQCQRCTNCCRWPGFVKITDDDVSAMAQFLGTTERDFIDRYTRLRQYRDGLALLEKPNGECVFLNGRDCAVQPVKPKQCRGFPNEWNFPGWREVCEAVPLPTGADAQVPDEESARRTGSDSINGQVPLPADRLFRQR